MYLLQVWSKTGYLYFERKLVQKPTQWNIAGKVLILKEEISSNVLYLIKLRL